MSKLVSISEAADVLGVSVTTLRRWEREGKIKSGRTHAGHRRYDLSKIKPELFHIDDSKRKTIAYIRVSSHDQKTDLERQKQVLELYCARQGWTFEVIADFEEDLAKDVLEIITVFSARLYGSRSRKNQKLLDGVKQAVEEAAKC